MERSALSTYVRTLARGPGRSRHLTETESYEAFSLILTGKAPKEAVGALLMLMRFRSENADEITGAIKACHDHLPAWLQNLPTDLDWPSYAAGKSRGLPYFLLAALTLSQSGITVFMHGFNSHQAKQASTEAALKALGLTVCETQQQIEESLQSHNFAYLPLSAMSSALYELINLREILGLRSPINTVLRGLNPSNAKAALIGVFHPPYIPLQASTATQLNNGHALILKGGGGEAERAPYKPLKAVVSQAQQQEEVIFPALRDKADMQPDKDHFSKADHAHLKAIWQGKQQDPAAESIIIGTIATALYSLGKATTPNEADGKAANLWQNRVL